MKKIRKGVFETNSSSTHSICISKEKITSYPSKINFYLGEYGWEEYTEIDCASYLYTAIANNYYNPDFDDVANYEDWIEYIKEVLDKHDIKYCFEEITKDKYYYIDHGNELYDFLNDLRKDKDKLLRFICGDKSCVYTGNDSGCGDDAPMFYVANVIWDDDKNKFVQHPEYDEEKFEYYFKGN